MGIVGLQTVRKSTVRVLYIEQCDSTVDLCVITLRQWKHEQPLEQGLIGEREENKSVKYCSVRSLEGMESISTIEK